MLETLTAGIVEEGVWDRLSGVQSMMQEGCRENLCTLFTAHPFIHADEEQEAADSSTSI